MIDLTVKKKWVFSPLLSIKENLCYRNGINSP
jgi:hypothetical protein